MVDSSSIQFEGNIPRPVPTPVPTLVLMLKSTSFCRGRGENGLYLKNEVRVQITPQIYRMNPGEMADCYDLFEPWIFDITPSSSHHRVLFPVVADLVAQGEVPLSFEDYSSKLCELYSRN